MSPRAWGAGREPRLLHLSCKLSCVQVQITCAGAEAVSEDARSWALPGRGRQGGGGRVEVQTRLVEEEDDAMELFKINRSLIWGCFQRSVNNCLITTLFRLVCPQQ